MTTIAITGVSGGAGQLVLRRLANDPAVKRIIGIDARDPAFRPPALEFHRLDLASADLKSVLEPADVVAHLSFLVAPRADAALTERVNIEGTRRVLEAAGGAGIGAIVVVSSAMVYGAWPNNPVPLTEDAPLRPNPGVTFATQKAEIERLVARVGRRPSRSARRRAAPGDGGRPVDRRPPVATSSATACRFACAAPGRRRSSCTTTT